MTLSLKSLIGTATVSKNVDKLRPFNNCVIPVLKHFLVWFCAQDRESGYDLPSYIIDTCVGAESELFGNV